MNKIYLIKKMQHTQNLKGKLVAILNSRQALDDVSCTWIYCGLRCGRGFVLSPTLSPSRGLWCARGLDLFLSRAPALSRAPSLGPSPAHDPVVRVPSRAPCLYPCALAPAPASPSLSSLFLLPISVAKREGTFSD